MKLKPCPFCGGPATMKIGRHYDGRGEYTPRCQNPKCPGRITKIWLDKSVAEDIWNNRAPATIATEVNLFDKEEIHHNCTVQVWTNTATGQTSIGWWPEGEAPEGMREEE